MATASPSDVKFEIGHVLFIDIVGFSKLLINEQTDLIGNLKNVVRQTAEVRLAEAEGKLIQLATGDGAALVFRTTAEAPVRCAIEISKVLKTHAEIRVRMGIHSGPVNEIADLNQQANVAGAGINLAQRVMDCGDAGHILLSKRVADDLEHYARWRPYLHDVGQCEVKHGLKVSLFNFYADEIGNPSTPEKCQRQQQLAAKSNRARSRNIIAGVVLVLVALLIGFFAVQRQPPVGRGIQPANSKSIAVLPFENLSHDPDNAYFADGIQDEILARLSQIRQLKVISRTSTKKFKSAPPNLREIAQQLGVANILEGSVQKAADQVRVNVQLISAITDVHLWSEIYDRKLTDVFLVESDIAKRIAEALEARLSGVEARAISAKPTENARAHQLYLMGLYFSYKSANAEDAKKAIGYFNQAIAADPRYAEAYAAMAVSYFVLPFFEAGAPKEYYPKSEAAAKKALEIDANLAEGHIALAKTLCEYHYDFTQSIAELQRALGLNPNSVNGHWTYGVQLSYLGRFDEGIAEIKRALELDPLNLPLQTDLGLVYNWARRYDEAIEQLRRTLDMDGGFYDAHWAFGVALEGKGSFDAALAEYRRAQALEDDPGLLSLIGHVYAVSGNRAAAENTLKEMHEVAKHRYIASSDFAQVYIALGEKEEALHWLEKGYEDRENLVGIRIDPFLDPLRSDPRFEALAGKIIPANLMR